MSKRIINVGAEPGDLGDGDTLRDAFIKTQENFEQLFSIYPVVDTTLNHDDPAVEGTIAKALADAAAAGGGTVLVGPGTFNCPSLALTVGQGVTLKGVSRRSSIINVTGAQQGILLSGQFASIESLRLAMPDGTSSDGIVITGGETHLRDLAVSGGSPASWAINIDRTNIVNLSNIRLGGSGNPLRGNGIIFQNSPSIPINFGDSKFSKIDILLKSDNTTGIKFQGSDIEPYPLINNILMSQVEVIGTGATGTCVGIHLYNAQRIVSLTVDLEELGTAIIEEGVPGLRATSNNVYIAVFAFGVGASYVSDGLSRKRFFFGCDNIAPTPGSDGDVIISDALWLNNGSTRIWETSTGSLQFDSGFGAEGLKFSTKDLSPTIQPTVTSSSTQLTLGNPGTLGVECQPGVILSELSTPINNAKEGTLAQFAAGVVGPNAGLYQLRQAAWVFIG